MPIKLKKTISASALYGNSVLFNGTNQYLSIANNAAFDFGTGDFTIEGWVYLTTLNPGNYAPIFSNAYLFYVGSAGQVLVYNSGDVVTGNSGDVSINTWTHIAYVRSSTILKIYVNGVLKASATVNASVGSGTPNRIFNSNVNNSIYSAGYASNVRVVKGTAVYTSSFTPPTAPLTAIANTSLLTCQSATIIDNSTNNFTITNNNSATVSSAITPFSASLAYGGTNFKKNIYPRVGRSVQFNGSNQYLSGTGTLVSGATTFTAEAWIYLTSTPSTNAAGIIGTSNAAASPLGWLLRITGATYAPANRVSFQETWSANELFSDTILSNNTWYHIAAVRSGSVSSIFINGIKQATTGTFNQSYTSTNFVVGRDWPNVSLEYFPGYISNVRVVSGTAVYTSNFTPPTSPLTAISGTSLLTCQSPTIIDNSSNNFTITNNNTAVVSTTNPFGADTTGGGMGMKKSAAVVYLTQKAIFGYGNNGGTNYSITNLVSNTGIVANDTTGVGTSRHGPAAAGYGTDKAIFGYGTAGAMTNLVSNTGVVATNTTGVGTVRNYLAAAGYGSDKAIFGYGSGPTSLTNLVSNTGVVATDTTGVGTARSGLAATGYGSGKAIFGYGNTGARVSITNLVSNTGVVSTDTTGVGTSREGLAAASYGTDKAIFGYGNSGAATAITNLVSNTGIVATDTTGVGTARFWIAAAGYGSDKSIFGYGQTGVALSITNLVSNTGVVATDTTGVGTVRNGLAAAGYSLT
jgi:hypothetical protein